MDDGRHLIGAAVIHRPGPDQLQVFYIGGGDLLERRMTPALVIAAVHQPVAIGGIGQHGVGDGLITLDRAWHRQAEARGGIRGGGGFGGGGARCGGRGGLGRHLAVGDS